MTNTQLWGITPTGTKVKLDLYETDPIKLTFTAENLIDLPTVNSTYSQTFKLPATGTNNQFFKYWFSVNSNDFDVSKKTSAEIVTEAGFFIDGQIRLQKVFRNYESALVDYEILFLGEVRDFSTQVGEGFMNTIDCNDLVHTLNHINITSSWNALAGTNNGLKNGNVLYPLVEYGYSYNQAGQVQQNQIQAGQFTSGSSERPFTTNSHALDLWQWRPWVRAKYLIDKIFNTTDYTYSSVFFESDLFQNLYVNATGNIATPTMLDLLTTNLMQVVSGDQTHGTVNNVQQIWNWPAETFDSGNNWNGNTYTVPLTGAYTFNYNFDGDVTWVNIGGGTGSWPDVTIEYFYKKNGTITVLGSADNGGIDPAVYFYQTGNLNLNLVTGDIIQFGYRIIHLNPPPTLLFETTLYGNTLVVTSAPVSVNPGLLLSDKVKTIDWFKSIIKRFRLVMVPDRENPRNFIIEPWNDYIATGDSLDWTHKIDGSKDIQFEPLFFTQSSSIKFTDAEDTDHPNDNHQKVFKEVYGTKIFDSANELLKDERIINTVMAPTPVERVEYASNSYKSNIIIPHLAKLDVAENATNAGGGKLTPIVAKPRLVFWNGIKPNAFVGNHHWHMYNDFTVSQQMHNFPMVSYMSEFPTTATTTNLSWELEYPRFTEPPTAILGSDIYTKYWKAYIDSTYSNEARKMTATFILDAQDLKVKFNDSIFIRDSWWRILKITNAPLTGLNPVKVELIKLLDAPDADCDCLEYYVTDNRTVPEGIAYFNYVDCITKEITTGQVFQQSVRICACAPFTTGDPLVNVTPSGLACAIGPKQPVPVDVFFHKDIESGGTLILQKSLTGIGDWINILERDIPIGPSEINLPIEVDADSFLRVGYSQTESGGNAVVAWYRNEELVNGYTWVPSPDMIWTILGEKTIEGNDYRVNVTVE